MPRTSIDLWRERQGPVPAQKITVTALCSEKLNSQAFQFYFFFSLRLQYVQIHMCANEAQ